LSKSAGIGGGEFWENIYRNRVDQEASVSEEWKEVVAEWKGEMAFEGRNQAGGTVQIGKLDGKPGIGPMEMLLLGAAGCTGMDIVSIMEKMRQDLQSLQVKVRGKRAGDYPKVYKEIEITYLVWGCKIDPRSLEMAIELSEAKYCSASIMLGAVAKIRSSYKILQPGETFEPGDNVLNQVP
jgi:putative redox protein